MFWRRHPLSPWMQFSLNLHGMMHSRSQILTLIALDGLLSYVSGLWTKTRNELLAI